MKSRSKSKSFIDGLLFVVLFVLQQIIAFIWEPFNYVTPYWQLYIFIIVVLGISYYRFFRSKEIKLPLLFFIISTIGALFSIAVDSTIVDISSKVLYSFIGLVGFSFLIDRKINTNVFYFVFIVLYVFFFIFYFNLNEDIREEVNGDLFGHSSSNAISFSLNIVWMFFYYTCKGNLDNKNKPLMVFAIINLLLIIVQGSRAGIIVAAVNILLILSNIKRIGNTTFICVLILSIFLFNKYSDSLSNIIDVENMKGFESYAEDVRGNAANQFFLMMKPENLFLGYPPETEFGYVNRTFNAFLDFWSKYGLAPLVFLIIMLIRRIIKWKSFSIPIRDFSSLIIYSMVESIWGSTLWDILIYIVLFYSYDNDDKFNKKVFKTDSIICNENKNTQGCKIM